MAAFNLVASVAISTESAKLEPFLTSARHALSLLMGNALSVGAVTIISEYVMLFGKVLITASALGIAYAILTSQIALSSAGLILMLVFIGIIAYCVASVFISVFGVCIDTVLLSYCYDLEQNAGTADRPFFFPEEL